MLQNSLAVSLAGKQKFSSKVSSKVSEVNEEFSFVSQLRLQLNLMHDQQLILLRSLSTSTLLRTESYLKYFILSLAAVK